MDRERRRLFRSVKMPLCLSIYLLLFLYVCLSICLPGPVSINLSTISYMSVWFSMCLLAWSYFYLPTYLCLYVCMYMCLCVFFCMALFLSIYLLFFVCMLCVFVSVCLSGPAQDPVSTVCCLRVSALHFYMSDLTFAGVSSILGQSAAF